MFARIIPHFHHLYPRDLSRAVSTHSTLFAKRIDYSRVPVLDENDLEEEFMRGWGPGGQAVSKTNNCVQLRHKPTNTIVKCHATRSLQQNQREARRILITKLDNAINGENSVENQKKQLELKKSSNSWRKRAKMDEMKKQWKERENIGKSDADT